MSDTEVGRQTGKVLDDAIAVLSICSQDQLKQLKNAIESAPIQESQVVLPVIPIQVLQEANPTPPTLKYEETHI